MKKKTLKIATIKAINIIFIFLAALVVSCRNTENSTQLPPVDTKADPETVNTAPAIDTAKIIDQLQGKWKESEYPFRSIEFKKSTARFIEEGIADKIEFKKFEISDKCLFNVNNIRDLKPGDLILSLPDDQRCEKLEFSNDTLSLRGFSTNTKQEYRIVYLKVK